MRIIFARFVQTYNRVQFQNQSNAFNQVSKTVFIQPKRYYKNFGHAEEGTPTSTMLWFGLGMFFMIAGSFRYLQYVPIFDQIFIEISYIFQSLFICVHHQ